MTAMSLHPTPKFRVILNEQIHAVGIALRREGVFFFILLAIMAAMSGTFFWKYHDKLHLKNANGDCVFVSNTQTTKSVSINGSTRTGVVIAANGQIDPWTLLGISFIPVGIAGLLLTFGLPGLFIPFGVWRSEDPARRSYHWAMPVSRGPHTLIKVLAGWLWLIGIVAVYIAFLGSLVFIGKYILNPDCGMPSTAIWKVITSFTAATVVYLMTSVLVIGSGSARRWMAGLIFLYIVTISFSAILGLKDLLHTLGGIVTGDYGLLSALVGGIADTPQDVRDWLCALALWGGGSLLAVCLAAYQRRDTYVA